MSDYSASDSPATVGRSSAPPVMAKRRPIPRKGHTKSRGGCSICKGRKVKCDEVSPQCGPCGRLDLECEYLPQKRRDRTESSTSLTRPLRTTPGMFDVDDMNFFRHFMFEAYPPLPIDGFSVWQNVSRLSHEYDFLLHSMLALGASHLGLISPSSYKKAALKHRVVAIKSLNDHLSKPNLSVQEAEAAFGAILNLTFQAAQIPDGLVEFLTMIRGCFLIGIHTLPNIEMSLFSTIARTTYIRRVQELVYDISMDQRLNAIVAREFFQSTVQISPLCKSVPELRFLGRMQRIASLAVTDLSESIRELSFFYEGLVELTSEEFATFIDPDNHVSRLVIMHMLVLDFVISRKTIVKGSTDGDKIPRCSKAFDSNKGMFGFWIDQMLDQLPPEYEKYAMWPVNFVRGLDYSFELGHEVWRPFLLSIGKATLPAERGTVSAFG
ncbi:hypothetical protein B0J13DRAFT_547104 [Dactylonectria estremocensis]|uniref:Zn(2)-C6 fungal-type domain-containing protein n=1 Tax=Dactylonectria estremocensis TaxID=1079267 RepID=A0A9P9F319_9HYPO|nr:hypothetical protein B0J13DRAFT_547104 [Dactylonectria estremocensis]